MRFFTLSAVAGSATAILSQMQGVPELVELLKMVPQDVNAILAKMNDEGLAKRMQEEAKKVDMQKLGAKFMKEIKPEEMTDVNATIEKVAAMLQKEQLPAAAEMLKNVEEPMAAITKDFGKIFKEMQDPVVVETIKQQLTDSKGELNLKKLLNTLKAIFTDVDGKVFDELAKNFGDVKEQMAKMQASMSECKFTPGAKPEAAQMQCLMDKVMSAVKSQVPEDVLEKVTAAMKNSKVKEVMNMVKDGNMDGLNDMLKMDEKTLEMFEDLQDEMEPYQVEQDAVDLKIEDLDF